MTTDELESYDRILPGLSGRIQAMVSAEQKHRRRIERAGQAFGLFMAGYFFALILLDFAYHLLHTGQYGGLRFYVF